MVQGTYALSSTKPIDDIVESCACISATVDGGVLTADFDIRNVGRNSQKVTVVFEDETMERVEFMAVGERTTRFDVILISLNDEDDHVVIQANVFVLRTGPIISDTVPSISHGEIVSKSDWRVLEEWDATTQRPSRQIMPVEIRILKRDLPTELSVNIGTLSSIVELPEYAVSR